MSRLKIAAVATALAAASGMAVVQAAGSASATGSLVDAYSGFGLTGTHTAITAFDADGCKEIPSPGAHSAANNSGGTVKYYHWDANGDPVLDSSQINGASGTVAQWTYSTLVCTGDHSRAGGTDSNHNELLGIF